MKTIFLSMLIALGSLVLPGLSYAAMYQYVDVTGSIQDITADNAEQALVTAVNIAPNSGVIHVTEQTELPENMDVPL